ncbi:MAG TPA: FKBP-type peptidyl-prolyl cis-trans isomerase [Nitrosomonas sp.]|nr:peptidylprolyl isomerase [Nitrosomonas sp.]HNP27238.1 FKBP-type peptidyl-prolyl cis-trans isomerase [Nitrosomonas sp.]
MFRRKNILSSIGFVAVMLLFFVSQSAVAYQEQAVESGTQLEKIDRKIGEGEEAVIGKTVNVHYTGWLYDENAPDNKGRKFDSSHDRKAHFSFMLGAGKVIKGWDQGVRGMKVGGERTLIIPPSMAYGSQGAGRVIPPNATLVFDVELLGLQDGAHY